MRCPLILLLALSLASPLQAEDPQVEFTRPTNLLSSAGDLEAWGWARHAHMLYNREAIPAERLPRVKEWEHYTVMSPKFTAGITIAQIGGLTFASVELIDYAESSRRDAMFFGPQSKERSIFPANPYGSTELRNKENFCTLKFDEGERTIAFHFLPTPRTPAFTGKIQLANREADESIAITRPFPDPGHFFYENKIFAMPAQGSLRVAECTYDLPQGSSFAIFDWGRGIWPRKSSWFWGQGAGKQGERTVAINLGHGYGDDAKGTANAILIAGKLTKLRNVACEFDPADRMKPWKFTSDDGRLELTFQPIYHQEAKQDILVAATELHKIHGTYSGKLVVDGQTIQVDGLLGFAEHMNQRW
ncbi:MAG: DUF2804 domain-containing protein [Planctomycetaceae bacterium]|nr:DUF2804 domain-containing protein [Planctomycetaceae bacterium]